jgi:hypothetical protein
MEEFRPDGLGHIVITGGVNPPEDIAFTEIVCDLCNADAGAAANGSEGRIYFDGSDSLCEECGRKAERQLLADMVASIKAHSFVKDYKATDAEATGLLIARFFLWDGPAILRAAQYALEEANFHSESARVSGMADAVEKANTTRAEAGPE